jgi:hypothetical protein
VKKDVAELRQDEHSLRIDFGDIAARRIPWTRFMVVKYLIMSMDDADEDEFDDSEE